MHSILAAAPQTKSSIGFPNFNPLDIVFNALNVKFIKPINSKPMSNFNPFVNVAEIHNEALDYFISVQPDPYPAILTVDAFIEPFVDFACSNIDNASDGFKDSFRSACKQMVFLRQTYSISRVMAWGKFSDIQVKYINILNAFTNPLEDMIIYIDELTDDLLTDTKMGISDKFAALRILSFAQKSAQYWQGVHEDPGSPWKDYRPNGVNPFDPVPFDVVWDAAASALPGGFVGDLVVTGIWGENTRIPGFAIGAVLAAIGSSAVVLSN